MAVANEVVAKAQKILLAFRWRSSDVAIFHACRGRLGAADARPCLLRSAVLPSAARWHRKLHYRAISSVEFYCRCAHDCRRYMRLMFKCHEEGRRALRRVGERLSGALDENGLAEVCQKHISPHQTSPILHHARRHHGRQRSRGSRKLCAASLLGRHRFAKSCS